MQQLRVRATVREREPNPHLRRDDAPEATNQQPAYVEDDVIGLVVAVPRDAQKLLVFAIDNGTMCIALVSPLALQDPGDSPSTLDLT